MLSAVPSALVVCPVATYVPHFISVTPPTARGFLMPHAPVKPLDWLDVPTAFPMGES